MEQKGDGKREAAGSSEPPKRRKRNGSVPWCATCWCAASTARKCVKGHRLVTLAYAEAEARSAVSETCTEVERLLAKAEKQQRRLHALDVFLQESRAVLKIHAKPDEEGIVVEGGDFKVVLAVSDATVEEVEALRIALEGVEFHYSFHVDNCLPPCFLAAMPESLFEKLPLHPAGRRVRKGTVLVTAPRDSDSANAGILVDCDDPVASSVVIEVPGTEAADACFANFVDDEEGGVGVGGGDDDSKEAAAGGGGDKADDDVDDDEESMEADLCSSREDTDDERDYGNFTYRIYTKSVMPLVKRRTRVLGRVTHNLQAVYMSPGMRAGEAGGGLLENVRVHRAPSSSA